MIAHGSESRELSGITEIPHQKYLKFGLRPWENRQVLRIGVGVACRSPRGNDSDDPSCEYELFMQFSRENAKIFEEIFKSPNFSKSWKPPHGVASGDPGPCWSPGPLLLVLIMVLSEVLWWKPQSIWDKLCKKGGGARKTLKRGVLKVAYHIWLGSDGGESSLLWVRNSGFRREQSSLRFGVLKHIVVKS